MKKGYGFSLTVLLLCLLLVFRFDAMIGWSLRMISKDYKVAGEVVFNQNNDFEYRASVFEADRGYVVVDPLGVEYVSEDGQTVWKKDLASQNVVADASGKSIAVAEKKSGNLFLLDLEGNITATHSGLGSVTRIKVLDSNHIGVLLSDNRLLLLDKTLEIIATTTLPSGEVIDFDIDASREDLVAVLLDLDEDPFDTKLVFATFNGSIDRGSSLSEDIVYALHLQNGCVWVVTDSEVIQYDFESTVLSKTPIDGTLLKFVYHESDRAMYLLMSKEEAVLSEGTSTESVLRVDASGNETTAFQSPMSDVKGIVDFGDKFLFYSDSQLMFVATDGAVIESYPSESAIVGVHVLKDGGFAVEYENALKIYSKR